jgi:hypothetical protein
MASSVSPTLPIQPTMPTHAASRTPRLLLELAACLLLAGLLAVLAPAASPAAITTFGSPLSVPATLNTSDDLGYLGTYTAVPPSPDAPNGRFHTAHNGADTALWNVGLASGDPRSPATGQAVKVSLEGCAKPSSGGPQPLTQIHFQDLSPLPGGGARVKITSQAFDIPVCGQNGAGGSTISTYEPINLCVAQGDYVAFNDEGGYVSNIYRSGVGYQVIGSMQGSTMNSFIRGGGTGNGATMSSGDITAVDGFSSNRNDELMLQVTLGTGPDATHICAGGSGGLGPALPPLKIRPQTDGVNEARMIAVSAYCRPASGCRGVASLALAGKTASFGRAAFSLPGNKTSRMSIRVTPKLMALIRRNHGVSTLVSAVMGGKLFTQTILVKIL